MESQAIEKIVTDALDGAECVATDLTGTADHWGVDVTWQGFHDMSLIDQHRRVLDVFRPYMSDGTNEIHAVQISTSSSND